MSEEPSQPTPPTAATPANEDKAWWQHNYVQDPLFAPPRADMLHLTDAEYEAYKASAGTVGMEYDEKLNEAKIADRQALMAQLGLTAAGNIVSVELYPKTMTRGDIDVRNTPTWRELSTIQGLYRPLGRAKALSPLDEAFFRLLTPIMEGREQGSYTSGECHPNAVGQAFMGKPRSKGRPERVEAFKTAMRILQHGTPEERKDIIYDMQRRLAIAKGEPAVEIAKQLVLRGMPLKPGEEYGDDNEPTLNTT